MTDAQFASWVTDNASAPATTLAAADSADSAADWGLEETTANIAGFQRFYCPQIIEGSYACYKWQPITGTDGNPRFDTDSTNLKAYYFSADQSPFIKEEDLSVLAGAQTLLAGLTVTAALLMAF